MPPAESILAWATTVANEWRWVAIVWHAALGALVVACASRWRPSTRVLGMLLVLPILSVCGLAWLSGNPFNGAVFAVLPVALATAIVRLPARPLTRASRGRVGAGIALTAFGLVYPHFVTTGAWVAYLYASPFGLLPCPTLSVVIGITLVFGGLQSPAWCAPLFVAGLLYGFIGVFRLGVALDVWLLAGAKLLGALMVVDVLTGRVARAHARERMHADAA